MRYAKIHEIQGKDAARIEQLVSAFIDKWHSRDFPGGKLNRLSSYIEALDYIVYEALYPIFAVDVTEFIETATAVFGKVLEGLLHFKWCHIELPSGYALGLSHPETDVRIPLQALIAAKLSGLPQFDTFCELFFDVYDMQAMWPDGYHPLAECIWTTAEDTFFETWGFEVPVPIKKRFFLLTLQDESLAVRRLGLSAYDWITVPNWSEIEIQLSTVERDFSDIYGSDWSDRARTEYAHLLV